MRRVVVPEMLDALSPEAREAQRSRRDLVRINGLMGNQRWLMGVLANRLPGRVVEIGWGDGTLASALVELGWRVTAVDLSPKPASCAAGVDWVCGDLRDLAGDLEGDVLIGNLVWHHSRAAS